MKTFTILVDMDNVLENLDAVWVDELNKRHGLSMKTTDITEWDMSKFYPTLKRDEIFAPLHDPALWERVEPLPHAQDAVEGLIEDGHDVVVVTASHPNTVKYKYDWLGRHFPKIRYRDIVFASRKQLIDGDFLIDDAPHNLFGGRYKPILFSAAHNRMWEPKKITEFACWRVADWFEAEKLIRYWANLS